MITEDMIPQIENAFGFQLYDWQKDYILGKIDHRAGGRHNGNTFAYCLRLLLSEGEPIKRKDLYKYIDESHGNCYKIWFSQYCLCINDVLIGCGMKTRLAENEELNEHRCSCGRLLGRFNGQAEIKCPKCGKMNVIGAEKR